jgi:hypothetical protein
VVGIVGDEVALGGDQGFCCGAFGRGWFWVDVCFAVWSWLAGLTSIDCGAEREGIGGLFTW